MAGNLHVVRDRGDYVALLKQRRLEMEAPWTRRLSWLFGLVAFVVTLGLLAASRLPMTLAGAFIAVAAFFGIWSMIPWLGWPLFAEKIYPPPADFTDPIELLLKDDGIQASTELGSAFYAWPSISDIVQTKTHYFVRKGGATVIAMPRRALDANADASQFLLDLRNHIRAG